MSNIDDAGVNMHPRLSVLKFYSLIFSLAFAALAAGIDPAQPAQAQNEVHLNQFDRLTDVSGWILLDQHLFWTSDAGRTWDEISPSIPSGAVVQDVSFIDSNTGWLLWTSITPDDNVSFQLAHTIDHGVTWTSRALTLFNAGEIGSDAEKAEMGWFDAQTGWISVKQNSGSNFSIGALFTTSDGGGIWRRFTLPVADEISFSDSQVGWAIGGAAGDQIFKTENAGASWQNVRPDDLPANAAAMAHMPFYSGSEGLLVMTSVGQENGLRVYSLEDSSDRWLLIDQATLDIQSGVIGLSVLDSRNFVATLPGTTSIVHMLDGKLDVIQSQDDRSSSIVELDMVSLDVGWAKSVESSCITASLPDNETASVSCSSNTRLLQTTDGGISWQSIRLPLVESDVASRGFSSLQRSLAVSATSGSGNTEMFIGQGIDKCEIPTISQLQTWWNSSPYRTVNLYIGGSSRACTNSALTFAYVQQISRQGWKLVPTWVGPQAPCTGFLSRFSNEGITAYTQGVNEANLAVERLAELGLTNADKTGSVVYYDIEYYGTDSLCRNAANAFMSGWVSQIRARGNLAGVYASTQCNTGLSDFLNIPNIPDVIWPARWYHNLGSGYYDPNANVWNLGSCVPNTVWASHQRIRQYEGGHYETWGNLTLEIDSNVLDGIVATPKLVPLAADLISPKGSINTNYNPTYSWNKVTDATWYYLWVNGPTGNVIKQWYEASLICSGGTCSVTPDNTLGGGDFIWWVQTWNKAGYGPWSSGMTFSTIPLGAATLLSPTGDIGADYTPTYTWNKVTGADWYYLWVNGPSGNVIKQWYDGSVVCGASTCSATPSKTLVGGDHTFWVQTWNSVGFGPWSSSLSFSTVPLGAATLVSPSGTISTTTPTYIWNKITGATWYHLWLSRVNVDGTSTTVHTKWYAVSGDPALVCGASTCSVTPAGVTLTSGGYRWWIRTWNPAGYGPWSSAMNFTVSP